LAIRRIKRRSHVFAAGTGNEARECRRRHLCPTNDRFYMSEESHVGKQKNAAPFQGTPEQEAKLREIIAEHKDMQGGLMPLLQKAQELYGYLPIEVQKSVAEGLNLPLAEVAGVVSFYAFFTDEQYGRYIIRMCKSAPCHVKTAAATLRAFKSALGIKAGETTPDGKFTLVTCECLGLCDRAPAVMVNKEVFGPILPEDAAKFLAQFE
jgi:NADH:ubiquinone oxidoreductase subunit E